MNESSVFILDGKYLKTCEATAYHVILEVKDYGEIEFRRTKFISGGHVRHVYFGETEPMYGSDCHGQAVKTKPSQRKE